MVSSRLQTTSSGASTPELRRSSSSTARYQQEPFSKFQDRVKNLCATLWPDTPTDEIKIERMRGGSYNRVIKITVSGERKESPKGRSIGGEYVLRIPRGRISQIEQELAAIFYVREKTKISVPETIEFDLTRNNAISEVYNIQSKIPGRPLCDVYMTIPQTERLLIIGQLAEILNKMQSLDSSRPGFFGTKAIKYGADGSIVPEIKIVDFKINTFKSLTGEILWGGMKDDSAKPKPVVERFLIDQFEGWREFARKTRRGEKEDKLIGEFCKVVREMKAVNLLGKGYLLFHPDFAPQNILVFKPEDEGYEQGRQSPDNPPKWVVSGILDWDGTAFVPCSVACTPPTWIWNWDDDGEEDEAVLCKTFKDQEAKERKEEFDRLMTPYYTKHAYSDGDRLVRRLFEFARNGFSHQDSHEDARMFLEDWRKKFPEIEKAFQSSKPANGKRERGFNRVPRLFNGSLGACCFS